MYREPQQFHLFLLEENLVLAHRTAAGGSLHPALSFRPLVDNVGLWKSKHHKPVEFLTDLKLDFQDCNKLRVMRHFDRSIPGLNTSDESERCVRKWSELQDGQHILTNTPTVRANINIFFIGEKFPAYI